MKTIIDIRRAYEPAGPDEGYTVYVDRLWPRGLSHLNFRYDFWDKAIAPSTELREWFHADPAARWEEFQRRYAAELEANPNFAALKKDLMSRPKVTLLYSSHDPVRNNAAVLREALRKG